MLTRPDENILSKAIEHFGRDMQLTVVIEELSELIKAICKKRRGLIEMEDIIDEIADVNIMLTQLMLVYNIDELEVSDRVDFKMQRLIDRLKFLRVEL